MMMEDPYIPKTLFQLVQEGIDKNKNKVLSATKRTGKWLKISPSQFSKKVRYLALALHHLGVRKGDKITLQSENSNEWLIADQAILSLGAVDVPIHISENPDEVVRIIEHSEAKIHIFSKYIYYQNISEKLDSKDSNFKIISLIEEDLPRNVLKFNDLLENGESIDHNNSDLFERLSSKVKPDDLATIVYTLGTEGNACGVMLTHNNISSNVWASQDAIPFNIENLDHKPVLSYLPLSHILERMVVYLYLYSDLPVYFIEHIEEIMDDFMDIRPIHFTTVPRLLEKLYTGIWNKVKELEGREKRATEFGLRLAEEYEYAKPFKGYKLIQYYIADKLVYSKIRESLGGKLLAITSGGAALSAKLMNFINALGIHCSQGYGLTEASPVLSVCRPDELIAGSVGKPLRNVEIKIEEDGEILAKGPNIMKGYYKNPSKTEHVITKDGWLRTGDLGHFDNEGNLFITGRKKELIKLSTGKYIAPANIEIALERSEFIEQAAIIGYGQKYCAALIYPSYGAVKDYFKSKDIELSDNHLSENSEVFKLIESEVFEVNKLYADWEQVKQFRIMQKPLRIEDGELNHLFKKKRSVIQEHYKELISSIYG